MAAELPALVDSPALPGKLRGLLWAHALGLPVPATWVVEPDQPAEPLDAWLSRTPGPWIVRAAHPAEDRPERSHAGLSATVGGCRDAREVRAALAAIQRAGLAARPASGPTTALIQPEIERVWLAVVGLDRICAPHLELFGPAARLDRGDPPAVAGPLAHLRGDPRWGPAASLAALARAVDRLAEARDPEPLDVEAVLDPAGVWWIVQVRPLCRPLLEAAGAFVALAERAQPGRLAGLSGPWRCDLEHNPRPLSPAHAWLVEQLEPAGPAARLAVVAGWLYEQVRPACGPTAELDALTEASRTITERWLPAAEAELEAAERALRSADAEQLAAALDARLDRCRALLTARASLPATTAVDPRALAGRHSLADQGRWAALALTDWDLGAPTYAELAVPPRSRATPAGPPCADHDPVASAVARLRELDDLVFSAGLVVVRRWWLAFARRSGLGDRAFWIDGARARAGLRAGLTGPEWAEVATQARQAWTEQTAAWPCEALYDGQPCVPAPTDPWAGVATGSSARGRWAWFGSLERLVGAVERGGPPGGLAETIVGLDTLPATAALWLAGQPLGGVVTRWGSALSHGALIARELGIPGLLGCSATDRLAPGDWVEIDARTQRLRPLA